MRNLAIMNIYATVIIFLLAGCSSNNSTMGNVPPQNPQPNIYVAGWGILESHNYPYLTAVLWKNGQTITFPDYTYAHGVAVSGNDVYVLGDKGNQSYYWKVGQPQPIMLEGSGYVITVSGKDVYVGGSDNKVSGLPCYWKDGQKISLPVNNSTDYGAVSGIAVSGSDVYMSGYNVSSTGISTAVYWKNRQQVVLASDAFAGGIVVHGNDVYVCGNTNSDTISTAVYWKNGQQITLTQNRNYITTNIAVSGSDVYVAGYLKQTDEQKGEAVYWKNGQQITLAQADAQAYGIAVFGSDVYVSGFYAERKVRDAVYWKNGEKIILGSGVAFRIAVQ